ncbi:SGNH/GDSL hydrolase family protein [Candidatus Daviesbacteria bacterium]|nr:SGNH/GDSL hydrolase family protein [Candidatus Daviesbacteria bacterium]
MVGDSMTEKLGNSDELRTYLKKYYPNKTFEILNYGFGSTNILSVQDRLEKETFYNRTFRPILDIAFDLILIESFGHNPLSQFPLDEGLKKQTEALDKIVATIKRGNSSAKIVFVATIAPSLTRYGEGQVNLDPEKRAQWAKERIAYIQNHISYANSHQIPVINIYEKSLDGEQGGNLDYISTVDFIHPSSSGVYLISEEIAKFIFENQVLPK